MTRTSGKGLVATLTCLVATSWIGGDVTAQAVRTVPGYALEAVRLPLHEFLRVLARVTPAGIEIKEQDDMGPTRVPPIDEKKRNSVTLAELATSFNMVRRDYLAVVVDDVFVIRPVQERTGFLDSVSVIVDPITVTGVQQSLRTILSPLDSRLLQPTVGASAGKEALKGLSARFQLDGSNNRRVINTLNQLSLQVPGVWVLTTRLVDRRWTIVKYGFIYSDSARMTARIPAT